MTIECENLTCFFNAIQRCVEMGVGFKARPDCLVIYLNGDF
jgi:hypothetical protein